MKRTWGTFITISTLLAAVTLTLSIWRAIEYNKKPEFSPVPDQVVETIPDPGIPDVTGRKKGLVQLSAFSGMFKSDKERREWLEKWSQDKETKDWVKDLVKSDPMSQHPRSTEDVFGEHRIVPTTGGAEDEAPFYSDPPVEYTMLQTDLMGEHWYGGSRVIIIPDEDCACVCCPCCPCPTETPAEGSPIQFSITPIKDLPPPVEPPVWPPINPPVDPPIDPPGPPKVPEASTIWMLVIGLAAVGVGHRI